MISGKLQQKATIMLEYGKNKGGYFDNDKYLAYLQVVTIFLKNIAERIFKNIFFWNLFAFSLYFGCVDYAPKFIC